MHWSKIGPASAPDSDIMRHAAVHDCVVLTNDLDFSALLAGSGNSKPSVIQIRSDDTRPETIGISVLTAMAQMEDELARGAILTIDTRRVRLRLLPLWS
jgi:predicted nuclease of predicted toxin-antitoxin system